MLASSKTPTHVNDTGMFAATAYAPLSFNVTTTSFGRSAAIVSVSVDDMLINGHY